MIRPAFVRRKTAETTLYAPIGAGSIVLPVSDISEYDMGEPVFLAAADGSEVEYVGTVQSLMIEDIIIEHPTRNSRAPGDLVWQPESVFTWPCLPEAGLSRSFESGVLVHRALDGSAWPVRVSAPFVEHEVRFRDIARAEFEAFADWLEAHAAGGLEPLTWINENRVVYEVQLLDTRLEQDEKRPGVQDLALRLAIIGEERYA